MPVQRFEGSGISPGGPKCVFVISKHCPPKTTTYAICCAAEQIEGVTCYGAQLRAGLWRIQTNTSIGRIKLLASKIELNGQQIEVQEKNPHLRGDVEDDEPSTKLFIDDLPFSFGNDAIDRHLKSMNVKCRTKIQMECDKDPSGGHTEFRTGRRSVWINLPLEPLPRSVRIGNFQANLFHWEMKTRDLQCRKCLQNGHKSFECTNEEVCLKCKMPGHRKGDRKCTGKTEVTDQKQMRENDRSDRQKCKVCNDYGHKDDTDMRCPQYWGQCCACNEWGHNDDTDILCPHHKLYATVDAEEQTEVMTISQTNTEVTCGDCGSKEHLTDSIKCIIKFPSLGEAGSPEQNCAKCTKKGHTEENPLCELFSSSDQRATQEIDLPRGNIAEEREKQQMQTVDMTDEWALTESLSLDVLFLDTDVEENDNYQLPSNQQQFLSENGQVDTENPNTGLKVKVSEVETENSTSDNSKVALVGETTNAEIAEDTSSNGVADQTSGEQKDEKEVYPIFKKNLSVSPEDSKQPDTEKGLLKRPTPDSSPDGMAKGTAHKGARCDPGPNI